MERAYINISKSKLLHNFKKYQIKYQKPIIAVVKANGYGHGAVLIAKILTNFATFFAVANIEEALELVKNRIKTPILVFGVASAKDYYIAKKYQLILSLNSVAEIKQYIKLKLNIPVHLKINTGLNRLGINANDLFTVKKLIKKVNVTGVYTHYSNKNSTSAENAIFLQAINFLQLEDKLIHTGEAKELLPQVKAIRIGLGLYGLSGIRGLKQIMTLKSGFVQKRAVKKGASASYQHHFKAPSAGYFYTLPIGYGDGWLQNRKLLLNDSKLVAPICMDYLIFFSKISYNKQKKFVLLGDKIKILKYVELHKENVYQFVTTLTKRLQRFQIK